MQDASLDAAAASTELVRSGDKVAGFADVARADGLLDPALHLHKKVLGGYLPNRDTLVDLGRATTAKSGCGRCDVVGPTTSFGSLPLPVGLGLAGLGSSSAAATNSAAHEAPICQLLRHWH